MAAARSISLDLDNGGRAAIGPKDSNSALAWPATPGQLPVKVGTDRLYPTTVRGATIEALATSGKGEDERSPAREGAGSAGREAGMVRRSIPSIDQVYRRRNSAIRGYIWSHWRTGRPWPDGKAVELADN